MAKPLFASNQTDPIIDSMLFFMSPLRFWTTPLLQRSPGLWGWKPSFPSLWSLVLSKDAQCNSGLDSKMLILFSLNHFLTTLAVYFESLSCWKFQCCLRPKFSADYMVFLQNPNVILFSIFFSHDDIYFDKVVWPIDSKTPQSITMLNHRDGVLGVQCFSFLLPNESYILVSKQLQFRLIQPQNWWTKPNHSSWSKWALQMLGKHLCACLGEVKSYLVSAIETSLVQWQLECLSGDVGTRMAYGRLP